VPPDRGLCRGAAVATRRYAVVDTTRNRWNPAPLPPRPAWQLRIAIPLPKRLRCFLSVSANALRTVPGPDEPVHEPAASPRPSLVMNTTGALCQETPGPWRWHGGSIDSEKPKRRLLLCPVPGRLIDREVATWIIDLQCVAWRHADAVDHEIDPARVRYGGKQDAFCARIQHEVGEHPARRFNAVRDRQLTPVAEEESSHNGSHWPGT